MRCGCAGACQKQPWANAASQVSVGESDRASRKTHRLCCLSFRSLRPSRFARAWSSELFTADCTCAWPPRAARAIALGVEPLGARHGRIERCLGALLNRRHGVLFCYTRRGAGGAGPLRRNEVTLCANSRHGLWFENDGGTSLLTRSRMTGRVGIDIAP